MAFSLFRSPEPAHPRPPINLHDARQRHRGQDYPSPCVSVCRMTADRSHCEGCFRTIDEIRAWSQADGAARRAIWTAALQRAGVDLPEELEPLA